LLKTKFYNTLFIFYIFRPKNDNEIVLLKESSKRAQLFDVVIVPIYVHIVNPKELSILVILLYPISCEAEPINVKIAFVGGLLDIKEILLANVPVKVKLLVIVYVLLDARVIVIPGITLLKLLIINPLVPLKTVEVDNVTSLVIVKSPFKVIVCNVVPPKETVFEIVHASANIIVFEVPKKVIGVLHILLLLVNIIDDAVGINAKVLLPLIIILLLRVTFPYIVRVELIVIVFVYPVKSIFKHTAPAPETFIDGELESKKAFSVNVGIPAPPAPPDVKDQFALVVHPVLVAPTRYLSAIKNYFVT
jgi:hypothetical protein